jgi:hypothetical protein
MKRLVLLALAGLALLFPPGAPAQIVNPGFETWAAGAPTGWLVNNIPPLATPVTQSATARTGSSSLRGEVVPMVEFGPYGPVAWSYAPTTQRPAALTGYYQFTGVQSDSFAIVALLVKNGIPIAGASFESGAQRTTWTQFTAPFDYANSEIPDSVYIEVVVVPGANDSLHVGSQFLLDDLAFSGTATSVEAEGPVPSSYALAQNFPNPFNPSTLIRYELPSAGHVTLSVFTVLGQKVATLVEGERPAGAHELRFDASNLPSGMYLYRIQSGSFIQTRKMTLAR